MLTPPPNATEVAHELLRLLTHVRDQEKRRTKEGSPGSTAVEKDMKNWTKRLLLGCLGLKYESQSDGDSGLAASNTATAILNTFLEGGGYHYWNGKECVGVHREEELFKLLEQIRASATSAIDLLGEKASD